MQVSPILFISISISVYLIMLLFSVISIIRISVKSKDTFEAVEILKEKILFKKILKKSDVYLTEMVSAIRTAFKDF